MKIIFAGTPQVALPTLDALVASEHEVVAVLTREPSRRGRGKGLHASPVAERARELGIPVIESNRPADENTRKQLGEVQADLGVIVAYGAILSPTVLDIPANGWINLHFSNLPRWRGAAPVQHSILARDEQTATCVFQLESGLDTGPIFSCQEVCLTGTETADVLLDRLAIIGAAQTVTVANQIAEGSAVAKAQDPGPEDKNVTYAPRLSKTDAFIDFTGDSMDVAAQIRAVTSNPGAWTKIEGERLLRLGPTCPHPDETSPGVGIIRASRKRVIVGCQSGVIELGQVAPAGKKWMDADAWGRGAHLSESSWLGNERG